MKKQLLLLLLMIIIPLVTYAEAVEINGIWYNLVQKAKVAEVSKIPLLNHTYGGDIIIPSVVNYEGVDYTVTSIGREAFKGGTSITSISIPNSVTTIEPYAFEDCYLLNSIVIPNSVTKLGGHSFEGCKSLSSVILPDSLKTISYSLFRKCTNLATISIPQTVTLIEDYAFQQCDILDSVAIPDSVSEIRSYAFSGCVALKTINIPNSLSYLSEGMFSGCTGLSSVNLPDSLKTIPSYAFYKCTGLDSINFPYGLKELGSSAFDGCTKITSVSIPRTVYIISSYVFRNCTGLKTVYIGGIFPLISGQSFGNCPELTDVYCTSEFVPDTPNANPFEGSYIEYATLHVPSSLIEEYKEAKYWKNFGEIVKLVFPKHTLLYMVDGEEYKSFQIEEREVIIPEEEPTKEGYTFSGWSEIPETMPAYDVTVTGSFTINKYKLTFNVDGEEYNSYELDYGSSITPEPAPTKEGYTFSGWSEIPETMPAHDMTVTGSFTINKYKLTYTIDSEEYKSYEIEYGAIITPEAEPVKEGYTFSGWSEIPETMPAHDVTVTGSFVYLPKCATPIIWYENGQLSFTCDTEGAEFVSEITDKDVKQHYSATISLTSTYNISVYAKAPNHAASDIAKATLCWIDAEPTKEGITDGVTNVRAKPVLIQCNGNVLMIQGADLGTSINVFDVSGKKVGAAVVDSEVTNVRTSLVRGQVGIVNVSGKSIKVVIK